MPWNLRLQDPVSLPLRYAEGPESRIEGLRDDIVKAPLV